MIRSHILYPIELRVRLAWEANRVKNDTDEGNRKSRTLAGMPKDEDELPAFSLIVFVLVVVLRRRFVCLQWERRRRRRVRVR
jgi:hypothetical protein